MLQCFCLVQTWLLSCSCCHCVLWLLVIPMSSTLRRSWRFFSRLFQKQSLRRTTYPSSIVRIAGKQNKSTSPESRHHTSTPFHHSRKRTFNADSPCSICPTFKTQSKTTPPPSLSGFFTG